MVIIFLAILLILMAADAYIVFGVISRTSWWLKGLFLLPSAAYIVVVVKLWLSGDHRQGMLNLIFWLTLCVFIPVVLFTLISLIGKGIGLLWHGAPFWFNIAGIIIGATWLGISLYGIIYGWKKITVERVEVVSPKIPSAFNGYKIVQLSDFHIGTYGASPQTVKAIVDSVNSLNPDLIVFTGDLVNSAPEELFEFSNVLKGLKARDGVLSVLGNHDYCLYHEYVAPDSPARALGEVIKIEGEMGWQLLRNESKMIKRGTDSIAVIGVDNAGSRMFPDKSDLPRATAGLKPDIFKILLSHDPSHWRREVLPKSDIDLTLSGHTHAMQFKIGNWSPSKWTYPEWGGMYEEDGRKLYVSTGIGENIAFRFGAFPQIVLLKLHSSTLTRAMPS